MWEFELHDVLHESELAVLSNWPVDTGTGALSLPKLFVHMQQIGNCIHGVVDA